MEAFQAQLTVDCNIASGERPTGVLIVHQEWHVRSYLRMLLRDAEIAQIWDAANLSAAIQRYAEIRPTLVLLPAGPSDRATATAISQFHEHHPDARIAIVTSLEDPLGAQAWRNAGAVGQVGVYLARDSVIAMLNSVIGQAVAGHDDRRRVA